LLALRKRDFKKKTRGGGFGGRTKLQSIKSSREEENLRKIKMNFANTRRKIDFGFNFLGGQITTVFHLISGWLKNNPLTKKRI